MGQYIPLKLHNKPNTVHYVKTQETTTTLKLVIYFVQALVRVRGRSASWCSSVFIVIQVHFPFLFIPPPSHFFWGLGGGVKFGAVRAK